jgi:ribosome-binding ATPase YchF (GTP1/OBG family)
MAMAGCADSSLLLCLGGVSHHRVPWCGHPLRVLMPSGEKETRAWTIRAGMTAPQAAGVIHSDFEKGFIRAETVAYNDYVKNKG